MKAKYAPPTGTRLFLLALMALLVMVAKSGSAVIVSLDDDIVDKADQRQANRQQGSRKRIGAVADDKEIEFLVGLHLKDEAALDKFLTELYDPTHPSYQQYLQPTEFRDRFCPSQADVESVKNTLQNHALKIVSVSGNNLFLTVHGKTKDINTAFGISMSTFARSDDGEEFYAPDDDVLTNLPAGVSTIIGLNNDKLFRSRGNIDLFKVANISELNKKYPYITAEKLRQVYNITKPFKGKGQTAAVIQFDTYNQTYIDYFMAFNNISNVQIENVIIPKTCRRCCTVRRKKGQKKCKGKFYPCKCTLPPQKPGDGEVEVLLDMQIMLSMAPEMEKLMVYIAPNTGKGAVEMYNQIAVDNNATVISSSWGLPEDYVPYWYAVAHVLIFQQYAAQGQSNFAASGDSGAFDNGKSLSVDFPASVPYMTGVGGTNLKNLTANGSYAYETTWWNASKRYGGGGGKSKIFNLPSFQNGSITKASLGSLTRRNVPDVSLVADTVPGYAIYWLNEWYHVGGTSAAAPAWAAFTVLVNDYRATIGKQSVGFVNPLLYSLAQSSMYNKMFRDIQDNSTNGYFPAVPGYDLATGLGTLNGDNLMLGLGGCPAGKTLNEDVHCV